MGGEGGGRVASLLGAKVGVIYDVTGHRWMRARRLSRPPAETVPGDRWPCLTPIGFKQTCSRPGGGGALILPSCLDVSKGLCFDPAGSFQLLISRKEYWKLDFGLPLCKTSSTPTIWSAGVFSHPPHVALKIIFRLLSNIFTHPVFRPSMDGS